MEVTCTYQGCDYHLDGSLVNNLTAAIRGDDCVSLNLTTTQLAVCGGCTVVDATTLNAVSSGNCTAVCANQPSLAFRPWPLHLPLHLCPCLSQHQLRPQLWPLSPSLLLHPPQL